MSMPFDATLKDLVQAHPGDFLSTFDAPPTLPVSLLNVDLSTITTAADLVLGLGDPLQEIVHLDFQSSASATKHLDVLVYNSLLFRKYCVPVHSILLLLRPQAVHSATSGTVTYAARPGRGRMDFSYEVVRLWERSADDLLAGPPGTLPLAVLGALPPGIEVAAGLRPVVQRLLERLMGEAPQEEARRLLTAAFLLTGMRLPREIAMGVFRAGIMQDSSTYWGIIDEGRVKEAKKVILNWGAKRLGPASTVVMNQVEAIANIDRLERMIDSVLVAESWEQILATP